MGLHVGGDAVEDVVELLAEATASSSSSGQLDGQVEVPLVADVDDGAAGLPSGVLRSAGAHQEPGHRLDRSLGGREPDPRTGRRGAEALQALEGEGQMGSSLVSGHGVDLVDDDGADRGLRARLRSEVTSR